MLTPPHTVSRDTQLSLVTVIQLLKETGVNLQIDTSGIGTDKPSEVASDAENLDLATRLPHLTMRGTRQHGNRATGPATRRSWAATE